MQWQLIWVGEVGGIDERLEGQWSVGDISFEEMYGLCGLKHHIVKPNKPYIYKAEMLLMRDNE